MPSKSTRPYSSTNRSRTAAHPGGTAGSDAWPAATSASPAASSRPRTSRCTHSLMRMILPVRPCARGAAAAFQERVLARPAFWPPERMRVRIGARAAGILGGQLAGHRMPENHRQPFGQRYRPQDEGVAFRVVHAHRDRTVACHDLEHAGADAVFLEGLRIHEVVDNEGKRRDPAARSHEITFHRPGSCGQPLGYAIEKARMQA